MAGWTGIEPATSGLTVQTRYISPILSMVDFIEKMLIYQQAMDINHC